MKIYIVYDYEDRTRIRSIQTLGYFLAKGKTEKEVDGLVAERNKEVGFDLFRIMEVTDEMEAVLRFALGENEYKSYRDITDVYEKLKSIESDLDSIREDCYDMSRYVEDSIKKVVELVPEEDR